jgi:hypothetical protein
LKTELAGEDGGSRGELTLPSLFLLKPPCRGNADGGFARTGGRFKDEYPLACLNLLNNPVEGLGLCWPDLGEREVLTPCHERYLSSSSRVTHSQLGL